MSLRNGVLGLLSQAPLSGYDLSRYFRTYLEPMWSAQQSQVYRELTQLEAGGFVTVEVQPGDGRPDRKLYSLTPAGEGILDQWWDEPAGTDEVRTRDGLALKVFVLGLRIRRPGGDPRRWIRGLADQILRYADQNQALGRALDPLTAELAGQAPSGSVEHLLFSLSLDRGLTLYRDNERWARRAAATLEAYLEQN